MATGRRSFLMQPRRCRPGRGGVLRPAGVRPLLGGGAGGRHSGRDAPTDSGLSALPQRVGGLVDREIPPVRVGYPGQNGFRASSPSHAQVGRPDGSPRSSVTVSRHRFPRLRFAPVEFVDRVGAAVRPARCRSPTTGAGVLLDDEDPWSSSSATSSSTFHEPRPETGSRTWSGSTTSCSAPTSPTWRASPTRSSATGQLVERTSPRGRTPPRSWAATSPAS